MARIAVDPNYSSPTFPRATAGTDLFVKEDVQALAAAVSTHDHSTGKGLAIGTGVITSAMIADGTIVVGDIADGAITSAKILDATIATGDIADSAITSAKIADATIVSGDLAVGAAVANVIYAAFKSDSTTSTTYVAISATSQSLTLLGSRPTVVRWSFGFSVSTATGVNVGYRIDAGAWQGLAYVSVPSGFTHISGEAWTPGLSAGAHSFELGWSTSAGTVTLNAGVLFSFDITEYRR